MFNRRTLQRHRERAKSTISHSTFLRQAALDLIDRLSDVKQEFQYIADIGCSTTLLTSMLKERYKSSTIITLAASEIMLACCEGDLAIELDEANIAELSNILPGKKFDLITFMLGMHWINDIPSFLSNIHCLLAHNGIFIASFIGDGSLKNLRRRLIDIELQLNRPSCPHISPFIQFENVAILLQRAGFADIIVDCDNMQFSFPSPFVLMKELQNLGESNALARMTNYAISKKMLDILKNADNNFYEQVNIITVISCKNKNSLIVKPT